QALDADYVLDARKCLSYWTIEHRGAVPERYWPFFDRYYFGCDICQTVCPWNVHTHGKEKLDALHPAPDRAALVQDLQFLLTSPNRKLERVFSATPLSRINGMGLKRNALTVVGNLRISELKDVVATFAENPRLGELAKWALSKLNADHETQPL
ncbi:MAG: 4Fe-4S double cluster binding domain-containing protein, partial [Bdellovibrionota bacterium]